MRTSCGLTADWDSAFPGPCEPPRGAARRSQPAEGAGCSGSPEGRCASLRDGPTAHPSLNPLQPDSSRLWGATDKGYTGAGVGVHVPVRHHPDGPLHTDNRCYNSLIIALRAPAERGHALLGRWRALDRVTVTPQRIGAIAAAALVLTSLDRGTR
nr:transposase family protein [Geodermatophilus poikilotrophus]